MPFHSACAGRRTIAREDYDLALEINVVSAWDSYISRYPSGSYTDLAVAQRNKLSAAKASAAEQARLAKLNFVREACWRDRRGEVFIEPE